MDDVGQQVRVLDQLAAAHRLGATLLGEVDVDPAGEEVLLVPVGLAVAQQDERVSRHASQPSHRSGGVAGARQSVGGGSPGRSRRWRKASRLRRLSPRETRHSHSLCIEVMKPMTSSR